MRYALMPAACQGILQNDRVLQSDCKATFMGNRNCAHAADLDAPYDATGIDLAYDYFAIEPPHSRYFAVRTYCSVYCNLLQLSELRTHFRSFKTYNHWRPPPRDNQS